MVLHYLVHHGICRKTGYTIVIICQKKGYFYL